MTPSAMAPSLRAALCLVLVWAAIYLPQLGGAGLRGEEPRRIIPAQEMLRGGDWTVPRIGGDPYANKPPMLNWLIAASLAAGRETSLAAARLPSALSLLALALGALVSLRRLLGEEQAFFTGLVLLTTFAFLEDGRSAEIEALFAACFGLAVFSWAGLWHARATPWLAWTVPYLFLALGLLTKGPLHLPFWFLFVFATLRAARSTKEALHPAHFVGVAGMLALFLAWTLPFLHRSGARGEVLGRWGSEMGKRAELASLDWGDRLLFPLQSIGGFLPWAAPLAFALWCLRPKLVGDAAPDRRAALVRGALLALIAGSIAIWILPEGRPRYLLPLHSLAALATVALYFSIDAKRRAAYEAFAQWSLYLLAALVPVAGVVLHLALPLDPSSLSSLAVAVPGLLALAGVLWWMHRSGRTRGVFLKAPVLLAAAVLTLHPLIAPRRSDDRVFREGAAKLAEVVANEPGGAAIYVDPGMQKKRIRQLRLLHYLDGGIPRFGERSEPPTDFSLLIARSEVADAALERIGRTASSRTRLELAGEPYLILRLKGTAP